MNRGLMSGLIPPPEAVRAELARSVREAARLRALLRLAVRADEDRSFVDALRERPRAKPSHGSPFNGPVPGVAR